ncbi:MAG: excinuclease ABC subunit A [Xanthomonadaceae bacterium]|nr:excinuclease ABC subunit A [Xanthomonadaceae bacterium]
MASEADGTDRFVRVRGAREHNLRDVDVDIPREALVVFSGVSGSGKSSLAFSTIYAEAQRRYLDSVSPYARRLIHQVGVPDVDAITGLPPAVALQQQRGTPSVRSSVGSVTTLSSLIRMLYSRAGTYPPRQPMLYAEDFSPNTPQGACPVCHGLGHVYETTEDLLVPDPSRSIARGAVAAWPPGWHGGNLRDILTSRGVDIEIPWHRLPKETRDWILYTDEQPTVPVWAGFTLAEVRAARRHKTPPSYQGTFTGARAYVLHTFATTQSALMKRRVARFLRGTRCASCAGKRLKPEALSVRFGGLDIGDLSQRSPHEIATLLAQVAEGRFEDSAQGRHSEVDRAATRRDRDRRADGGQAAHTQAFDANRTPVLSEEKRVAAQRIARNVVDRIAVLERLGLGYLSMDRATPSLSAGELQRLRLATQIQSQLFGVVYVLDEPSAGLHPADGEALIEALQQLRGRGNSVFVVEHDLETMRRADWIVDVGPGAGENGGRVLYSGPPEGLRAVADSQTARVLFDTQPAVAGQRRRATAQLGLHGISRNNLHEVDVQLPLGVFTVVTGLSGSGKSSLISRALVDLVRDHLGHEDAPADADPDADSGEGPAMAAQRTRGRLIGDVERIRRLVVVDQKPIGRTPRSNLATYTGLLDPVRRLFAATPAARARRFDAGRFSFNVGKGRCATCEGEGFVSVEMMFMPSVFAPCPTCKGARYNEATLAVQWRDRSIADVLRLTVDEALSVFSDQPAVHKPLTLLRDLGLGYLRLGQPATEFSGGEAQRIKLATELQRAQRGDTLYVLDEPTTGLHPVDADRLFAQLDGLVERGNTVVVVEHDLRVIVRADWVIDVGPGAGAAGGTIVATGTPEKVAQSNNSRTAVYLRRHLEERASAAGGT